MWKIAIAELEIRGAIFHYFIIGRLRVLDFSIVDLLDFWILLNLSNIKLKMVKNVKSFKMQETLRTDTFQDSYSFSYSYY